MHTRSLHVLASPQLGSFQLEPSALQLPVPNSYQTIRTQSQVTPLAGATNSPQLVGASWYSPSIIGTARPNFFEPQQSQVQGGTTSPYYNAQPTSLTQYQPVFVPSSGTANYTFQPYCERDEKQQVLQLQHIGARPEFAHKSAEELRLEDYAANGVAPLTASNNEPGQVAMPSANNTLGSGGSLFGTSTVGLFGSSNQFQQPNPSLGDSFLSPSVLSNFPQQTQPNLFQSAAAGVDVNKPSIPFWGTTTAGFGAGFGAINNTGGLTSAFGSAQPNTNINSLWGQTQPQPQQQQQPSTVFGTLTNGSVFANQAPQTTAFTNFGFQQQQQQQQQQPANSSFTNTGFFNPNPAQSTFSLGNSAFPNTGFGFGFNPSSGWGNSNFFTAGPTLSFNRTIPFQYPTEAHFFWNNSPIVCWNEFLSTLPSSISTASFGGVMVHLPSIQECQMAKAREKQQASRLAKINADPFGIEMIQPLSPIVLNDTNSPTVSSVSSSVPPPASPLRQGTSSPLLTPNRSPLIAPSPQRTTDSLAVNGHQRGRSASFSRSPRLLPLPESPYVTAAPLQLTAANSSAMVSPVLRPRVPSAQSSPHKSLADRPTSNSHNSPKVSHSALFSHPPGSPQRLTSGLTNGHDREGRNDNNMIKRELEWSARLVE